MTIITVHDKNGWAFEPWHSCRHWRFFRKVKIGFLFTKHFEIEMRDREKRAAIERHWAASDGNDFETEHEIYRDDAVLDYPQSGERIHGRHNIQESRTVQPSKKRFFVRRILGNGDLWITELVLTYDGVPSYTLSIMQFKDGKVASETQYFCDPFKPGPSRAHLVELVR